MLDTLFPIKCLCCGMLSSSKHNTYVCKKCLKNIQVKKQFECIGCKINSSLGETCLKCRKDNYIDQLLIVTDYNNPSVVKIIKAFKYRFVTDMIEPISLFLKKYIFWLSAQRKYKINSDNPIIVPVPLFYRRLNWRGFNQAELIASSLADMLQTYYQPNTLLRIRGSKPQADISEKIDRLKNPTNIFKLNKDMSVGNKTMILVDDICTTGATLNECARILKESGAKKIIGFVIARG
ncbi:MAG: phosphoribosyltransferase family protein [bacterium]|nr:phosphoribosyltransferase family protein [bacterium]